MMLHHLSYGGFLSLGDEYKDEGAIQEEGKEGSPSFDYLSMPINSFAS
jgi:hypothetical protein